MADELNIPTHRWYQPRYNISLPNSDFSKQWIFNSGIQKIDAFIGGGSFSPSTLFALAEPGVWFDPSDLTTLFTDPAGTTPVTGPTGPTGLPVTVGLMLDKSKGLALGAELVENGTFDGGTTTGWTSVSGGTLSVVSGSLRVTNNSASFGGARQEITVQSGKWYRLTFAVGAQTLTSSVWVGNSSGGTQYRDFDNITTGTYQLTFLATSTTLFVQPLNRQTTIGNYSDFDNISVRELAGNHATQATLAARPTYSIEPVGGRRNLLLYSEQFDNAYWSKTALLTVSPNTAVAPDGSTTAELLTEDTANSEHRVSRTETFNNTGLIAMTQSIYCKPNGRTFLTVIPQDQGQTPRVTVDIQNNTFVITNVFANGGALLSATSTSVGDGWYRVVVSWTASSVVGLGNTYFQLSNISTNGLAYLGNGTSGIYVWGAQLELGSTATPYQRVTTQHDVTEAGVASLGYLYFDGAGDFMFTSTITPGTDKAQVFAGVRKLSDAVAGAVAEFSSSLGSNSGAFLFGAPLTPASTDIVFRSKGTATGEAASTGQTAPITRVATGLGDIAGDSTTLRLNGVVAGTGTGDQGTGNYLAYPLFIGSRGNAGPPYTSTSLPFLGHLYSLITRFGPTLDAPTITSTEIWVGGKTGIDIAKITSTTIYTRSGDTILDRANSTIERRAV